MKCCPHIEALYKKKPTPNQTTNNESSSSSSANSNNFDHVEKLFKLVVELNHQYFGSNGKSAVNNDEIACIKCSSCDRMSRLYMCAHCFVVCCHSHAEQHARLKAHPLAVEITYAAIYCHVCKDFQYNQDLEEFVCQLFLKENFLPFGKFNEWQPSQKNLDLLKKNYNLQQPPLQQQQPLTIAAAVATIPQQQPQKLTFKLKTSSIIGLRGLINLGNTCFMNCILQTLTHIPSLRDYFLGDQHYCSHPNGAYRHLSDSSHDSLPPPPPPTSSFNNGGKNLCLVCELVTLFHEFYSGKRSPYIPYTLLHQVWTQVKHLAGYEQQDAHEFFIAALNSIHKNCIENDQICISLNKNRKHFRNYNNCNCIIDQIFTGGLQSDVICSNCNHISTTVDPFWDISLDIYKNTNKSAPNDELVLKLEDCLLKFTLPEILTSFNCSKCKCSREARKQFTMKKLPIVCCFHLKRFEQSNRIHKKIFDHISFPEILDMSPFMSSNQATNGNNNNNNNNINNSDNNSNNSNEDDSTTSSSSSTNNNPVEGVVERMKLGSGKFDSNKYFLFAVVNHYGTLESGHYTSFIRLKKDQWYKCDDHVISRATLNDVMSSEGYLLFYHKLWNNFE